MNILVTGALGFIGSNLIPVLVKAGHEVLGLDSLVNVSVGAQDRIKSESGEHYGKFSCVGGDVCDFPSLHSLLVHRKIDAVVHLAARGSVPRSFKNPTDCVRANELGFARLVETMNEAGVRRLVFASSSSVYGDSAKNVKVEGEEGQVTNPYALSKRTNEDFARIYCTPNGIQYVGLRFFNVYGPGQRPDNEFSAVIPRFINNAPVINGDGGTRRDFTFVGDVTRAIECALKYTEDSSKGSIVTNVGTGAGVTLKQLVLYLGKEATHGPARVGDVSVSIASTQLAEQVLGFKAGTPIAEGLEATKHFYENEAKRWL